MVAPIAIYGAIGVSKAVWGKLPDPLKKQVTGLVKAGAIGLATSITAKFLKKNKKAKGKPKKKAKKGKR